MSNIRRVYIAGPSIWGEHGEHVRNAILAGHEVTKAGHVPFVPHLYRFAHHLVPLDYVAWCGLDLRWLQACDCLVRLPGYSPSADAEVNAAKVLRMPVYYTLSACLNDLPRTKGATL